MRKQWASNAHCNYFRQLGMFKSRCGVLDLGYELLHEATYLHLIASGNMFAFKWRKQHISCYIFVQPGYY